MKIRTKFALACIIPLFLISCGGNAKVISALDSGDKAKITSQKMAVRSIQSNVDDVPEHFLAAVRGHLKNELGKRGLLAMDQEANHIDLNVTYYRMRSGITRMMFGVFAGKDGIEADIEIRDISSNKVMGKLSASSYNVMAIGNEDDIARIFAEKAAEEIEKSLN